VLGIDQLRIDANYRNVGANSVNLIRIHRSLEEELARKLPLRLLFESNSIVEFCDNLPANRQEPSNEHPA
jgi:hypothetical protein